MKSKPTRWVIGKALEGIGMVIVLVGLFYSVEMGFKEEGLKSMTVEFMGLGIGGSLFLIGYFLERGLRE